MSRHSAICRQRLRGTLKRLRQEADLSIDEVALGLSSSVAAIVDLESGRRLPDIDEVNALLRAYGEPVPESAQVRAYLEAVSAHRWSDFDDIAGAPVQQFLELASTAATIRVFQCSTVPGFLQTPAYTRALMREAFGHEETIADRFVRLREDYRRAVLDVTDTAPPRLVVVLDEAVLQRAVGGPEVMRAQLKSLSAAAQRPDVTMRVLGFEVGGTAGVDGSFTHLELPQSVGDDALYLETPQGQQLYQGGESVVGRSLGAFAALEAKAPAERTGDRLAAALAVFSPPPDTDGGPQP